LILKKSQQCIAWTFEASGVGYPYFDNYFEDLWNNRQFVKNLDELNNIK